MREAIETLEEVSGRQARARATRRGARATRRGPLADTSRIRADTGWEPRTPFAEGLAAQWKWAADRVANR